MKPETQIRNLVRHIRPLAECLKGYRPSARRIHVRKEDWKTLHANPDVAHANGFVIPDPEHISYEGFDLIPLDSHRRRGSGA